MKTYFADIIPKIQQFSKKLDDLTLLTNQHWVVVDEISNSKIVYIFRKNNELLIAQNGKVEKAKWEYLGNCTLLIDTANSSYLFKQGFFDENIIALKVDSKDEYAFLINESKYEGEINSIEKVIDFLNKKYLEPVMKRKLEIAAKIPIESKQIKLPETSQASYNTIQGDLTLKREFNAQGGKITKAILNGTQAPNGKYKLGFMWYAHVENGIVTEVTMF
jgi:ribosomal 30S subunit maturation factor RimM